MFTNCQTTVESLQRSIQGCCAISLSALYGVESSEYPLRYEVKRVKVGDLTKTNVQLCST